MNCKTCGKNLGLGPRYVLLDETQMCIWSAPDAVPEVDIREALVLDYYCCEQHAMEACKAYLAQVGAEANMERAHAECLALIDLLHRHPSVLTGVTVLQVELNGTIQCLITTDLNSARQYLADTGGLEKGILDLATVIDRQYAGIAVLTSLK